MLISSRIESRPTTSLPASTFILLPSTLEGIRVSREYSASSYSNISKNYCIERRDSSSAHYSLLTTPLLAHNQFSEHHHAYCWHYQYYRSGEQAHFTFPVTIP